MSALGELSGFIRWWKCEHGGAAERPGGSSTAPPCRRRAGAGRSNGRPGTRHTHTHGPSTPPGHGYLGDFSRAGRQEETQEAHFGGGKIRLGYKYSHIPIAPIATTPVYTPYLSSHATRATLTLFSPSHSHRQAISPPSLPSPLLLLLFHFHSRSRHVQAQDPPHPLLPHLSASRGRKGWKDRARLLAAQGEAGGSQMGAGQRRGRGWNCHYHDGKGEQGKRQSGRERAGRRGHH